MGGLDAASSLLVKIFKCRLHLKPLMIHSHMFTHKQSVRGGQAAQAQKSAAKNLARKAELAVLAAERGGFAKINFHSNDTLMVASGELIGREFFADTKPEAIFNDGSFVGGSPWFL